MVFEVVSVLLSLAYGAVLGFYIYGWFISRGRINGAEVQKSPLKFSVIIPARNEETGIVACLQSLQGQKLRSGVDFEVIVVDDGSDDQTAGLVLKMSKSDPRIRLISLNAVEIQASHKKRAVEAGINAATGQLIACTDADCILPEGWLSSFAMAFTPGKVVFMAAPVVFKTKPGLLSIFQTLDFMTLQGITAATVATGFHTMCNGANIAYDREVFLEVGGFKGIDSLPTGDDMLLMYKIKKSHPGGIRYLRQAEAIVSTDPMPTWKSFFNQRIRWASKAAFYDDKRIFWILLLVYLFNAWIASLFIAGIWSNEALKWALIMIAIKTLIELIFLLPVSFFFKKQKWLWVFPFLQPIHIIYTLIAGWFGRFGSYNWKGRTIQKPTHAT